jgi:SAM-dependent methyltransferase
MRGGSDLERLYFIDDEELGVRRSELGEEVFVRSVRRYEYATRYIRRGDTVLDCACGSGYGSHLLKEGGAATVLGIDNDGVTIRYARKHYGGQGIRFLCQDIRSLRLPEIRFDAVVSIETIEHIERADAFLRQVYKFLKPGGRAIVSTPIAEKTGKSDVNPYHLHEFAREDFQELMEKVFDVVDYFIPDGDHMPLELTDGRTVGLIFGVGEKSAGSDHRGHSGSRKLKRLVG